ncbi:efflux RND transporter permease subunit [Leeia sp.]|uniref:efflux RND transporter permease subunit n=1 Tax=Leeia sp. TaxID=2884678 RepID=UPI0035AF7CDB
MNFSAWAIKKPIPSLMLFILLTLAGILTFKAMKVQSFPDVELPMVTITAALPGAAPAQLESEVARKLENAVASLRGVKQVYSKIQDGLVLVTVEFILEKPITEAVDDVRNAVSGVRSDLPGDLKDPVISKVDFSDQAILVYTISVAGMDEEQLSWLIDNRISKDLRGVAGIGRVTRVGGLNRQVSVELDPARMQALGVTALDVSRQLLITQKDASGGRTELSGSEQAVRTLGTVKTAEEVGNMELALVDGRRIRLNQIATVKDTVADRRSAAMLDGKPVVGFELTRSRGAGEMDVATAVRARMAQLKSAVPGLQYAEVFDMATPVQEQFDGSMHLLYEGALLAIIVVWFFLRDWRATFVSAVALPLSVIPTFIGMHYFGFTLNVVTLLSLALVVGILVDDAIVEIENIVRHLHMGKTPYQAAMEAADEIGMAVIATTLALVAVFLPTAFMDGIVGRFFKQFGWTAALAVLASLLVARLLTPMMAAYMLKKIDYHPKEGAVTRGYMAVASWCLRHRLLTVLMTIGFFIGSMALSGLLKTGFVPADDMSQTAVKIELPPGSTFEQTRDMAERTRKLLMTQPYIKRVYTAIGGGSAGTDLFADGGAASVTQASLMLTLADRHERPITKTRLEGLLREKLSVLPGVRVTVGLGGNGEKYQMVLVSDDPQMLYRTVEKVKQELYTIPGLGAVTANASLERPEIEIRPDPARAADLGVTPGAIAEVVRVATVGDYDTQQSKLNLPDRQVPIVVRMGPDVRHNLELLSRLMVPGSKGPVMLGQVATLRLSSGPTQIERQSQSRSVMFNIELNGRSLGEVAMAVDKLPTLQNLPAGVKKKEVGDSEEQGKLFASFGLAMLAGVVCIYMVLVLLFHDFLQPITILIALPLSLGGAFMGLLIGGSEMGMPALIGLIMLMGIASKNSILLVEYAVTARDQGMARFEALMDACHKRARPIVMTSLAMGAGMLPIALGIGVDPSFRAPMAIAVIGGLVTSTILSLLVVPVFYTLIDDFQQFMRRKAKW